MAASFSGPQPRHWSLRSLLGRVHHVAAVPDPGERLECVASIYIPPHQVPGALASLAEHHERVRRYAHGADRPADRRIRLRDALRKLGQGADRATGDLGVVVRSAAGTAAEIQAAYATLAPFVAPGSYLQLNADSHLTFDGGQVQVCSGVHPQAQRLTRTDSPAQYGVA